LEHLCRALDMPRSSAYHLVNAMVAEGFVTHLEGERTYGLGPAAFEVGSGYARQAPLARIARRMLNQLAGRLGHTVHLAVPHGRDVLYVVEERAAGTPSLVTDVGVRLPASLTASGRAILAAMPASQVRALFPSATAFVTRNDRGPTSLTQLNRLLTQTRSRGYATEDGEVTPGLGSIAAAVLDHNGQPVAGVAVTFPAGPVNPDLVEPIRSVAAALSRRVIG
jgi:DNA-binding IclR family transcriptional regulator